MTTMSARVNLFGKYEITVDGHTYSTNMTSEMIPPEGAKEMMRLMAHAQNRGIDIGEQQLRRRLCGLLGVINHG